MSLTIFAEKKRELIFCQNVEAGLDSDNEQEEKKKEEEKKKAASKFDDEDTVDPV